MKYDAPSLGNRHSQHQFAQVPDVHTSRSVFDRSYAVKDTMDFDYLNPLMVEEILPGDTVNLNVKSFIRLAPQVRPVMDNMYVDYFFFFVPMRLVWSNFQKFMGEQVDPGDSIDYTIPTITINDGSGFTVGSIYDKMGIPTDVDDITINALPLRAYYLIYNNWFRDQNLVDSLTVSTGDGPDAATDYTLQKRAKKHDYFTSALPWAQKGTAVDLPIGTSADILRVNETGNTVKLYNTDANVASTTGDIRIDSGANLIDYTNSKNLNFDPNGSLYADLSNATAATINELRDAFLVQSLLELDARAGTRYIEIVKAHFNVTSPDARLQRPEFLSGGTTKIAQHPVAQTSQTSGTNYLGDLASFSTAVSLDNRIGFSKSFTEHGYIIGLVQARADITYQQGINRMWSRSTRYDFFWPKLQQLGEQEILAKEIYAQGSTVDTGSTGTPDDERTWAYQERYAEYRYRPSEIRGQFRSTYTSSLDVWHLAEEFSSAPSLNQTFIESSTPIERSLAVAASYPHLLCDYWMDMKHARTMMTYGVPATLGRF